jgi:protein TonB
MKIFVNENDEIMVIAGEERPVIFGVDKLDDLRQLTKEFITANTSAGVANENYPEPKPVDVVVGITVQSNKHVISLNADQGVSYECYTKVIEALYGAYSDLRAEFAVKYFGSSKRLTGKEIALCTDIIPEVIIEGGLRIKKVVPPPPSAKKIVDVIKVVEDDVEVEEQELVSVQDASEWGDVEETDAFFVEEEIFDVVEEQPEFPGGTAELMKYFRDNIKYPKISRDNNSQGKTFVKFIVNSDGSIQDAEIIKSAGDMYLDEEAVRVIEAMPKWKPGRNLGKAVRVKFVLPVNFRLQ